LEGSGKSSRTKGFFPGGSAKPLPQSFDGLHLSRHEAKDNLSPLVINRKIDRHLWIKKVEITEFRLENRKK
jgi:hypothetical protein